MGNTKSPSLFFFFNTDFETIERKKLNPSKQSTERTVSRPIQGAPFSLRSTRQPIEDWIEGGHANAAKDRNWDEITTWKKGRVCVVADDAPWIHRKKQRRKKASFHTILCFIYERNALHLRLQGRSLAPSIHLFAKILVAYHHSQTDTIPWKGWWMGEKASRVVATLRDIIKTGCIDFNGFFIYRVWFHPSPNTVVPMIIVVLSYDSHCWAMYTTQESFGCRLYVGRYTTTWW